MAGEVIPVIYDFQVRNVDKIAQAFSQIERQMNAAAQRGEVTQGKSKAALINEQKIRETNEKRIFKLKEAQVVKLTGLQLKMDLKNVEEVNRAKIMANRRAAEVEHAISMKNIRRGEETRRAEAARAFREERARLAPRYAAGRAAFSSVGKDMYNLANRGVQVAGLAGAGAVMNSAWRSMGLEQAAMNVVVNASSETGKGLQSNKDAAAALMEASRKEASRVGVNPADIMEGLRELVARTGELGDAVPLIPALANYTALGVSPVDLGNLMGTIGTSTGGKLKPEETMAILRTMGKKGAFEIKDFAQYMTPVFGSMVNETFAGTPQEQLVDASAALQAVKARGGSSAEIGTAMRNFLLYSQTNESELQDFGIKTRTADGARVPITELMAQVAANISPSAQQGVFNLRGMKIPSALEGLAQATGMEGSGLRNALETARAAGAGRNLKQQELVDFVSQQLLEGFQKYKFTKEETRNLGATTQAVTDQDVLSVASTTASAFEKLQTKLDQSIGPRLIDGLGLLAAKLDELMGSALFKWVVDNPLTAAATVVAGKSVLGAGGAAGWGWLKEKLFGMQKMNVQAAAVYVNGPMVGGGGLGGAGGAAGGGAAGGAGGWLGKAGATVGTTATIAALGIAGAAAAIAFSAGEQYSKFQNAFGTPEGATDQATMEALQAKLAGLKNGDNDRALQEVFTDPRGMGYGMGTRPEDKKVVDKAKQEEIARIEKLIADMAAKMGNAADKLGVAADKQGTARGSGTTNPTDK